MEYRLASIDDAKVITDIVHNSINNVYVKYYPQEVVDFFLELHSQSNIVADIRKGQVGLLLDDGVPVGTGSYVNNHITRVYVRQELQNQGYGSFIMDQLEKMIAEKYECVRLDASLSAETFYDRRGYRTVSRETWKCTNQVVLVYDIMEKPLYHNEPYITYNGRTFYASSNSDNGEVNEETTFHYYQKNWIMWADYDGGGVTNGHMLGNVNPDGSLDFDYHHINEKGQLRAGKCHSTPEIGEDGILRLYEEWQWNEGRDSHGTSVVVEKR